MMGANLHYNIQHFTHRYKFNKASKWNAFDYFG